MLRLLAYYRDVRLDQDWLLRPGEELVIGRSADADCRIRQDSLISRRHAALIAAEDGAELRQLEEATNPVFVRGEPQQQARIRIGQTFVIGQTRFELQAATQTDSPAGSPFRHHAVDRRTLQRVRYDDADRRIEVLSSLPAVVREAGVERDLYLRLGSLLLAGIPRSAGVALVRTEGRHPRVLYSEQRFDMGESLQPSQGLIRAATEQKATVLHLWGDQNTESPKAGADFEYTQAGGYDWAFCTPLDEPWDDRAVYVAGHSLPDSMGHIEQQLHADIKFTEFVAEFVSSLQKQRLLERRQSGLRQFFSPPVLEALGSSLDTSLLEPRECDVTVLFCDLRGFSHRAEEQRDQLTELLQRVSEALGVMTDQILRFGGVTGDFQGDAAMGFWGWPLPQEESAANACRSALAIREAFLKARDQEGHPLAGFETSIGIARGRAVAGKIGTRDQVKVTVFGPVVNLASRLEGMTRMLQVPVLIDESLAELVRTSLSPQEARVRRILRVQPYGMETPLTVSELVPPADRPGALSDEDLHNFEEAVDRFIAGDWGAAWESLHRLPAEDRAQDYLAMRITQSGRQAPADWDGVIRLAAKG